MRAKIRELSEWIANFVEWVCMIGLGCLSVLVFEEVLRRKFLNVSSAFISEFVQYLFVAVCYYGAVVTWKRGKHIKLDTFYRKFEGRTKFAIDIVFWLTALFTCAIWIGGGIQQMLGELAFRTTTYAMELGYFWVYLIFTIAMVLLLIYIIESGVQLLRSRGRQQVEGARQ